MEESSCPSLPFFGGPKAPGGVGRDALLRLHALQTQHVVLPGRLTLLDGFILIPQLYQVVRKELLTWNTFFLPLRHAVRGCCDDPHSLLRGGVRGVGSQ